MSSHGSNSRRTGNSVFLALSFSVCLGLVATSCGQRGPLYLPKPETGTTVSNTKEDEKSGERTAKEVEDKETAEDEDGHEETP